ncbi:MAG: hypothetical protein CMJ26_06525 [Phycisphaerae bacterium]|nr:hypothetical protein [Phycisphaerae bacterium]
MKKLLIILVSGTVLIFACAGLTFWLSWQPQSWYAPLDYSSQEIKTLADRAEYRLNEEFHKVRPATDVWRLRITDEAMNAWLSGRLEGWLTHDQEVRIPKEIQNPQVHITPSGVWVAAMVEIQDDSPRPVALQLSIQIVDGVATILPVAIRLGKMPIPMSVFEQIVQDTQERAGDIPSIVPLMDDREVQIQEITFEEGALVLTCQTYLPQ